MLFCDFLEFFSSPSFRFLKCVSRFVILHACIVSVFIQGNKLDIIKYKGDLLNPKKMMHVDKPPNN